MYRIQVRTGGRTGGFFGQEDAPTAVAALATVEDALRRGWEVEIYDFRTTQTISVDMLRKAAGEASD